MLARLRGLLPLAASMRLAAYLCLCLVALPAAAAAPAWLIATPDETARAGAPIMLDIVKPSAPADWPDTLRLRLVLSLIHIWIQRIEPNLKLPRPRQLDSTIRSRC